MQWQGWGRSAPHRKTCPLHHTERFQQEGTFCCVDTYEMSSVESKLFASTDISGDATHKRKRVRKRKPTAGDDASDNEASSAPTAVATTDVNKPLVPAAPRKPIAVVDARDPVPEAPTSSSAAPAASIASPQRVPQAKRSRPVVPAPGSAAAAAAASELTQLPPASTDVAALRAQVEALTKLVTSLAKPGHRSARLPSVTATPANMDTLLGAAGSPLLLPPVPESRTRTVCIHGLPFTADYLAVSRWLLMELVRARIIPAEHAPPREDKAAAADAKAGSADAKAEKSEALKAALAAVAAPGAGEAEKAALRAVRLAEKEAAKAAKSAPASAAETAESKQGRVAQYQATLAKYRGVKADLARAGIAQLRLVENKTHGFKGFVFVTFETDELAAATLASHKRSAEALGKKLAASAASAGAKAAKAAAGGEGAAAAADAEAPAAATAEGEEAAASKEGDAEGKKRHMPPAIVARLASGHPLAAMQGRVVGMEMMRSTLTMPVPVGGTARKQKGDKKEKKNKEKKEKKDTSAPSAAAADKESSDSD